MLAIFWKSMRFVKVLQTKICLVLFGGVMVIVLAIGLQVRGFKHCIGDGFLRAVNIRGTPSIGGEEKPEAPRRKILRHVKTPTGMK
jgi:hypothetical protein